MVGLVVGVIGALLVVTALGSGGQASFGVQQRTKQVGGRRALGATKGQILRYFQTENFLLATVGIALGMLLAFGINQMLMGKYELPRLPPVYLPIGAVALWVLGQIAVFWPARSSAAGPPPVSTRSVSLPTHPSVAGEGLGSGCVATCAPTPTCGPLLPQPG